MGTKKYLVMDTETVDLSDDSPLLMMQWGVFDVETCQLDEVGLWTVQDENRYTDDRIQKTPSWDEVFGDLVHSFNPSAFVFFNAKFDLGVLRRNGISIPISKVIDVCLIDYCEDTRRKSRTMDEVLCHHGLPPKETWSHENNARFLSSESWSTQDWKTFQTYALRDISACASLLQLQLPAFSSDSRLRKMVRLEHDYLDTIIGMESTRLFIDSEKLSSVSLVIEDEECEAMEEMRKVVYVTPGRERRYTRQWDMETGERLAQGVECRPGTVGGVAVAGSRPVEYIFDHCELAQFEATPAQFLHVWEKVLGQEIPTTGWENKPTTKSEALLPLAGDYSRASMFCQSFLDWKSLTKLRTSFFSKWEGLDSIGYNLNQRGTSTGRLSASNTNVQQIPRRGEKGEIIRSLFVAPPGFWFATIDLAAIDARCLAHGLMHFFGDDCFIQAIEGGEDFHSFNAKTWGLTRDEAKTAIYAIMFGVGAEKLGKGNKIEGQRIMDTINDKTPNIQRLKQMFWDEAAMTGEIFSHLGRRYDFSEYKEMRAASSRSKSAAWKSKGALARLERQIFSCYIQGTAADVFKVVTNRTKPLVLELGGVLVVPVHDELVVYFPDSVSKDDGLQALNKGMNADDLLSIPVRAEAAWGVSWASTHN